MGSLTTPFNKAHHRFATIVAFCTFLLIIAGALVTSNDAGLAVPDWPTSFHHWPVTYGYFTVPLVGGIRWEHGHRILAQFIGLWSLSNAMREGTSMLPTSKPTRKNTVTVWQLSW